MLFRITAYSACDLSFFTFFTPREITLPIALKLIVIGAVQLSLMYVFYYQSFLFLTVAEVLLFTVMTPIYVTLINDAFDPHFNRNSMLPAIIATAGAVAIRYNGIDSDFLLEFLMVQCANLCFAARQVGYKRLLARHELEQKTIFGWFLSEYCWWPVSVILFLVTVKNYQPLIYNGECLSISALLLRVCDILHGIKEQPWSTSAFWR